MAATWETAAEWCKYFGTADAYDLGICGHFADRIGSAVWQNAIGGWRVSRSMRQGSQKQHAVSRNQMCSIRLGVWWYICTVGLPCERI
jgi:hypothetical protein